MDDDRMIDDWLSGEECDPMDYDLYEINQFKRFMGQDEDEEPNNIPVDDDELDDDAEE